MYEAMSAIEARSRGMAIMIEVTNSGDDVIRQTHELALEYRVRCGVWCVFIYGND